MQHCAARTGDSAEVEYHLAGQAVASALAGAGRNITNRRRQEVGHRDTLCWQRSNIGHHHGVSQVLTDRERIGRIREADGHIVGKPHLEGVAGIGMAIEIIGLELEAGASFSEADHSRPHAVGEAASCDRLDRDLIIEPQTDVGHIGIAVGIRRASIPVQWVAITR